MEKCLFVAEVGPQSGAVTGQHHELAAAQSALHPLLGLAHEISITGTDPRVHHDDVMLHRCRDRESEPHLLASGKRAQAVVHLLPQPGELEDPVDLVAEESRSEAHRDTSQIDVLAHGCLAAEPERDVQQRLAAAINDQRPFTGRSEEHTSELQSLMRNSSAVFCLKKKT